jgi:phage baseplate assembly protein W
MAIIIQNKFALDSLGYKTIGFAFPISDGGVFPPTYTVKEQLRYNLINYLMTNPGESYLNPDFGAGLPKFIFEQINTQNLESIKTIVQNKITIAFPNIKVQKIDVYGNEDFNQIRIVITYNILNFGNDQITLQF